MICPKCGKASGDAWAQCEGACPIPFSPAYDARTARQFAPRTRPRPAKEKPPGREAPGAG